MLVNREELIRFYDSVDGLSRGHANAISTVAGEDLGAGLLKHYLEHVEGVSVDILSGTPTQKTKSGVRLDRWIHVTEASRQFLFQAEVKNWCAHSIGGLSLSLTCSPDELQKFRIKQWNIIREKWLPLAEVRKVLTPMVPPTALPVEPILIFWPAAHPEGGADALFSIDLGEYESFSRLWFFSMSNYVRSLTPQYLDIEMPLTALRKQWIDRLFAASS